MEAGDEGGGGLCVGELPWRLNFEGFHLPKAEQDKPARWLHDCLGMLGLSCLSDECSRQRLLLAPSRFLLSICMCVWAVLVQDFGSFVDHLI